MSIHVPRPPRAGEYTIASRDDDDGQREVYLAAVEQFGEEPGEMPTWWARDHSVALHLSWEAAVILMWSMSVGEEVYVKRIGT